MPLICCQRPSSRTHRRGWYHRVSDYCTGSTTAWLLILRKHCRSTHISNDRIHGHAHRCRRNTYNIFVCCTRLDLPDTLASLVSDHISCHRKSEIIFVLCLSSHSFFASVVLFALNLLIFSSRFMSGKQSTGFRFCVVQTRHGKRAPHFVPAAIRL